MFNQHDSQQYKILNNHQSCRPKLLYFFDYWYKTTVIIPQQELMTPDRNRNLVNQRSHTPSLLDWLLTLKHNVNMSLYAVPFVSSKFEGLHLTICEWQQFKELNFGRRNRFMAPIALLATAVNQHTNGPRFDSSQ